MYSRSLVTEAVSGSLRWSAGREKEAKSTQLADGVLPQVRGQSCEGSELEGRIEQSKLVP